MLHSIFHLVCSRNVGQTAGLGLIPTAEGKAPSLWAESDFQGPVHLVLQPPPHCSPWLKEDLRKTTTLCKTKPPLQSLVLLLEKKSRGGGGSPAAWLWGCQGWSLCLQRFLGVRGCLGLASSFELQWEHAGLRGNHKSEGDCSAGVAHLNVCSWQVGNCLNLDLNRHAGRLVYPQKNKGPWFGTLLCC